MPVKLGKLFRNHVGYHTMVEAWVFIASHFANGKLSNFSISVVPCSRSIVQDLHLLLRRWEWESSRSSQHSISLR